MDSEIVELIEFLGHPRPDVRLLAAKHVAGISKSAEQHVLVPHRNELAHKLLNLIAFSYIQLMRNGVDKDGEITHSAFSALINLTESDDFCTVLLDFKMANGLDIIRILMTMIKVQVLFDVIHVQCKPYILKEMACMLLSNLTRLSSGMHCK